MTEGRSKVPVIRDPAFAVAVAKCWLARTQSPYGLSAFHEEDCGFCEMPLNTLIHSLEEFGVWSGISWRSDRFDPSNPTVMPWRDEVERFARLPPADQLALVKKAQGHGEDDADD